MTRTPRAAGSPAPARIRLTLLTGRNAGHVHESHRDRLSVGRGERNDLILEEPHISLQHGEIRASGDGYVYRDLKSTNGSAIQRERDRILLNEEGGYEQRLRPGDRIVVGDARQPVLILFELLPGAPGPAPDRTVTASCSLENVRTIRDGLVRDPPTLNRMYSFLEELQPLFDREELFQNTLEMLRLHFPHATRRSLYLRVPGDDRFLPFLLEREAGQAEPGLPLSRTVQEQVLATQRSLLVEDVAAALPDAHSLSGQGVRSLLCAPLWNQGRISGILQLAGGGATPAFSRTDLELLTVFAHQVARVFEKIQLHELLREAERETREENLHLGRLLEERYGFENIVGDSPAMREVFALMRKAASNDLPVLILGETGTGKELVARAIHHHGPRRAKRFVPVHCGAITESLFESELFGHVRGAFTGAAADKKGLLEEADRGTVFLDEIGETPAAIQIKLLRFLQDGEIRPVGATRCRHLSVRILAAAQDHLQERIREGRFREDLFFRLNFFTITLPPLRHRREDIPPIALFWMKRYALDMGKEVRAIDGRALQSLQDDPLPGNVRELQNRVARAVALASGPTLREQDFPPASLPVPGPRGAVPRSLPELKDAKQEAQDRIEHAFLLEALRLSGGNISRAARETGINRSVFHEMLARHGISGKGTP